MKNILILSTVAPLMASQLSAINIVLDFDTHSSSFFDNSTNGATARAAVQAAADDISAAITSNLNALPSNRSFEGSNGSSTYTLTSTYSYTNPNTGGTESYAGILAADEFKIFVGAQSLATGTLGQGGAGVAAITGISLSGSQGELQGAADNASALGSITTARGGSILQNTSAVTDNNNFSSSLDFAPALGQLWFDNDSSTTWNFDHTSETVLGSDLFTVALHEILHSLGIGLYDSWSDNISGDNWIGAEVIESHGTGTDLIHSDDAHIAENIMSARLSDGVMQEVVMDPNITDNTRKELTELDLAFLRDLGWQTVPEPSSTLLLGLGSFALILRRSK